MFRRGGEALSMRVLFVLTSTARMGLEGPATGFDRQSFAMAYYAVQALGAELVLASPSGGAAPSAPGEPRTPDTVRLKADGRARSELSDTLRLDQVFAGDFAAAVYPGGPGLLWDLPGDALSAALILALTDRGAPVAMLAEAPAALRDLIGSDGRPWVEGRALTAVSNRETAGSEALPFRVEDELRRLGAHYTCRGDLTPCAVRDGPLITAQNAASTGEAMRLLGQALG
jgi:putative intracellular protease/amidase